MPSSAEEAETGLTLLGLLGLEDPPRTDVRASLDACREAGIRVVMVTGDHPATAAAIATEVGLRAPDDPVMEGRDLPSGDEDLGALVDRSGRSWRGCRRRTSCVSRGPCACEGMWSR